MVLPPPVLDRTGNIPAQSPSTRYPPALVQCVQCRKWTRALPCCDQCGAPLAQAPTGTSAPVPAVAPHASTPYEPPIESLQSPMIGAPALAVHDFAGNSGGETYQDAFSPLQAFVDLARVLWTPRKFFAAQVGADGMKAPMAFLLSVATLVTLALLLFYGTAGLPGAAGMGLVADAACGVIGGWISLAAAGIVSAGLIHGFARLFRGIGHFSGTFRVTVYSWAPYIAAMVLLAPVLGTQSKPMSAAAPERTTVRVSELLRHRASGQELAHTSSPSGTSRFERQAETARRVSQAATTPVLQFIQMVLSLWCTALLCCGLARVHQIHASVGFLAVLAACFVPVLLVGVLAILLPLVVAMRK